MRCPAGGIDGLEPLTAGWQGDFLDDGVSGVW